MTFIVEKTKSLKISRPKSKTRKEFSQAGNFSSVLVKNSNSKYTYFNFNLKNVFEAYSIRARYLRSLKLDCSIDETDLVKNDIRNDVQSLNGYEKPKHSWLQQPKPSNSLDLTLGSL